MASRLPNEENDESVRPMLGWDQAMAALQRNILQQNQQHHTTLNQATAAAIAAGLTPPTSLANAAISSMWPYNIPGSTGVLPSTAAAAAAAAASLASLGNPTNSYLNNLQNLQTPEGLLSFQQILLLEQLQQQRQLLAANPHLLMAVAAAQTSTASIPSQTHHLNNSAAQGFHQPHNLLNAANLHIPSLSDAHNLNGSPKLNNDTNNASAAMNGVGVGTSVNRGTNGASGSHANNSSSLLTTVNSSIASALTNQHQDSLVDQHFRRSLGEDYNQIMSNKTDKINVGK